MANIAALNVRPNTDTTSCIENSGQPPATTAALRVTYRSTMLWHLGTSP